MTPAISVIPPPTIAPCERLHRIVIRYLRLSQEPPAIPQQELSESMKGQLSRAIMFLQSDMEYEWPSDSILPSHRAAIGLTMFMTIPTGMAMLFSGLPIDIVSTASFMFTLCLLSIMSTLIAIKLIAAKPKPGPILSKQIMKRGDYDVWPFYRQGDHAMARNR